MCALIEMFYYMSPAHLVPGENFDYQFPLWPCTSVYNLACSFVLIDFEETWNVYYYYSPPLFLLPPLFFVRFRQLFRDLDGIVDLT
jgi:hypothetical protein